MSSNAAPQYDFYLTSKDVEEIRSILIYALGDAWSGYTNKLVKFVAADQKNLDEYMTRLVNFIFSNPEEFVNWVKALPHLPMPDDRVSILMQMILTYKLGDKWPEIIPQFLSVIIPPAELTLIEGRPQPSYLLTIFDVASEFPDLFLSWLANQKSAI